MAKNRVSGDFTLDTEDCEPCPYCNGPAESTSMVECECCKRWCHFRCVGFENTPPQQQVNGWTCAVCFGNSSDREKLDKMPNLQDERPPSRMSNLRRPPSLASCSSRRRAEVVRQQVETSRRTLDQLDRHAELLRHLSILEEGSDAASQVSRTPSRPSNLRQPVANPPIVNRQIAINSTAAVPRESNVYRERPSVPEPFRPPASPITNVQLEGPTRMQLAARHAMPKELPSFNGKASEWSVFISSFRETTRTCGYTHNENLVRLQKALKDPARNMVRSLLTRADYVPVIIEKLRDLYGRPETVVEAMLLQIRALPSPKAERLDTVVTFCVEVYNLSIQLQDDELLGYRYNPTLVRELLSKLPTSIQLLWSDANVEAGDVVQFGLWLNDLSTKLCRKLPATLTSLQESTREEKPKKKGIVGHHESTVSQPREKSCPICSKGCTTVPGCEEFKRASVSERYEIAKKHRICFRCLKCHSLKTPCRNPVKCTTSECTKPHHPLLHSPISSLTQVQSPSAPPAPVTVAHSNTHVIRTSSSRFRYVPITLINGSNTVKTFAFLDEGSDITLMTSALAAKLKAKGVSKPLSIFWTDEDVKRDEDESEEIDLRVMGTLSNTDHDVKVHTVSRIYLSPQTMDYEELSNKYPHLCDLPITSYYDAVPEILIGIDNWYLGVPLKVKEGARRDPMAAKCRLGWTIFAAPSDGDKPRVNFHVTFRRPDPDTSLDELVRSFYAVDLLGVRPSPFATETREDTRAREMMESTIKRIGKQFEIGLLWKSDYVQLPDSRPMAETRLESLAVTLRNNRHKREALVKLMKEYEEKKYIRPLTREDKQTPSEKTAYVPLFLVTNPNKPGKVRPVWDFAAQVNGRSLNSHLLSGPDLASPLLGVLFRFRHRKVALTGDIKEMFHRIAIKFEDQQAQRFLLPPDDPQSPPLEYALQVMSFGATCSPSCAQYVKNVNAADFREAYPDAYEAITENHHVDDWLQSFDTEDEAMRVAKEVRRVHLEGNFEIRNWRSNSGKVCEALGEANPDQKDLHLEEHEHEKVLGMWWNCHEDYFTYLLKFNKGNKDVLAGKRTPTKRELLRITMSIYDPMGLIANFVTMLKVLMQDTWRSGVNWDEPIPEAQQKEFIVCLELLPKLEQLRIPRSFVDTLENYEDVTVQLHTFVDASEKAEAAALYLRLQRGEVVRCTLVSAKTKVAPIKLMSIPDLELESAVLGARLVSTFKTHNNLPISLQTQWSDSKATLDRLQSTDLRKKRKFVAFRIAEVQKLTNPADWRYVPSASNVADDATKWTKPPQLTADDRWFIGPDFLYQPASEWPVLPSSHTPAEDNDELVATVATHREFKPVINLKDFSTWEHLRKIVRISLKIKRQAYGTLPLAQLNQRAEICILRLAQRESYAVEIAALKSKNPEKIARVIRASNLYELSPYLDEDELLRVRGRIDIATCVKTATKRPVILSKEHTVTRLLLTHYHEKYFHRFNEIVINEVRQKYAILGIRTLLQSIKKSCVTCKIRNPIPEEPEMGDLPYARVAAYEPPFTYTGMDFMGPFRVTQGRSSVKRWLLLFTCMTTRAIHIEVAYGLDSDSCIMCIKTFITLRGCPRELRSDQGTNFIASEKLLRDELRHLDRHKVTREFQEKPIVWLFNPPGAPHMGGAWERLIRAFKRAFYAALPSHNYNEAVFRCMIAEAAFIVNSRPLTYRSLDSEESEALTPNHWLLGSSNGLREVVDVSDDEKTFRSGYITAKQFRNRLWKRWVSEYLPDLVRRTKNFEPKKPLEVGDVVIVCDDTLKANSWPKGIVVETFVGSKGQTRSARVKTSSGTYHRPTSKLAQLDIVKRGEHPLTGRGMLGNKLE